jgi:hypothetical protein
MFIQGDQKVTVHLMITMQNLQVVFKVCPASLQTFIDTPNCVLEDRVQNSTVHISNVFCLKYCIFPCFFSVNVKCIETF